MFPTTRLTYVPSLKRFVRFKDIKNEHLMALAEAQDSPQDASYTQMDIIKDRLCDDEDVNVGYLTMIDSLFIFISWRINCVGADLQTGDGIDDYLDITEWLMKLHGILNENFRETLKLSVGDVGVGIPTISDDVEVQRQFMLGGVSNTNRIKENSNRHCVCIFRTLNGLPFDSYTQKEELFNLLPPEDYKIIVSYSNKMTEKLSKIALDLNIDKDITFTIDLISFLISFMFSGNVGNNQSEFIYLSRKCRLSYNEYMKLTPIATKSLIDKLNKNDQNGEQPDDEDLTEEYYNNF